MARLGVFSMSEVAREDNALMNYVFFPKSLRLFQRLSILHSTLLCRLDCLSARGQASIEKCELICN